jgi:L-ascorbate metabolism protein UlaG (beta-lactamase superfamily)
MIYSYEIMRGGKYMKKSIVIIAALFVFVLTTTMRSEGAVDVKLTWLGHAAVKIECAGKIIYIDPFLTGNSMAAINVKDVDKADYVFVTHGHGDHIGDTVEICKKTGALVVSNGELSEWFQSQGVKNIQTIYFGGGSNFDFGHVKMVYALHGSTISDSKGSHNGGVAAVFVFNIGGVKIYHAGDTGLTKEMELLSDEKIDIAILPIGGHYTMDVMDAVKAIEFIKPDKVIPIHYDTFPPIKADPQKLVELAGEKARILVLKPGDTM